MFYSVLTLPSEALLKSKWQMIWLWPALSLFTCTCAGRNGHTETSAGPNHRNGRIKKALLQMQPGHTQHQHSSIPVAMPMQPSHVDIGWIPWTSLTRRPRTFHGPKAALKPTVSQLCCWKTYWACCHWPSETHGGNPWIWRKKSHRPDPNLQKSKLPPPS